MTSPLVANRRRVMARLPEGERATPGLMQLMETISGATAPGHNTQTPGHGTSFVMLARIYPINECPSGRLAIMARPRAGDWLGDEITSWRQQGLQTIVSLLEDDEITELGLEGEAKSCDQAGLRFIRFPVPDRGVPDSTASLSDLVSTLAGELREHRGIGIHCRMGVGRSAMVAVCVLVALGTSIESAWDVVAQARGTPVPDTAEQRAHVSDWARHGLNSMKK